jgi:hypothetical protein
MPVSFHQLYAGSRRPIMARIDSRTLEMTVPRGWGGPPIESTVIQAIEGVPRVGDSVQVANMLVRVRKVAANGMPETVRFEFPTPLEAANRIWFKWHGTGMERWTPPAIGQRVTLDRARSVTLEPENPFRSFER